MHGLREKPVSARSPYGPSEKGDKVKCLMAVLCVMYVFLGTAAFAQEEIPHIGYVYPAGGQQGTRFRVVVGGQYLTGADGVRMTGTGVQAEVVDYLRPLNQGAFKTVQQQMQHLLARKNENPEAWTADDEKRVAELHERMTTFYIRPSSVPTLVETVTLEVTVAADAIPGRRELRLHTGQGLSNPLVFEVGQLREYTERSARSIAVAESQSNVRRRRPPEGTEKPMPGTLPVTNDPNEIVAVALPAILNGQILPGDVDHYRFTAQRGQKLVVDVRARSLIPYLSDAVPGWFQAVVSLRDAAGKEVAYADEFRFHPDPVLQYEIAEDGDYTLTIRDALYRGREDFVYRVAIGELPYVTGIFPLGTRLGTPTRIEFTGWNLPVTNLLYPAREAGVHPIAACAGRLLSNPKLFAVDTLPEELESEPNNLSINAQRVTLPVIINGRIDRPGDVDVFCFAGGAGQQVVAEVNARRLDSPLDSVLELTDATGKQLAFNDDYEDKGAGLTTHHADSRLTTTLPADGLYYIHLKDRQQHGGADIAYRLHLTAPQPDFELRVVPSAINARAGTTVPVTVHVLRRDNFAGEITLALQHAPPGFTLAGARIPAGQDMVRLTLTVPADAPTGPMRLNMFGRGMIPQREIIRQAVPADDLMQAFIYRHLVPAEELLVCVMNSWQPIAVGTLGVESLKIPVGGNARLSVNIPGRTAWGEVQIALSDPPPGITIANCALGQRNGGITFHCDAQTSRPGLQGNLIINVYAYRDPATMSGREQHKKPLRLLTALPAIPFEIVPAREIR
mgnify:CR=1 FL=1